jgi:hypothetical protein
MMKYLRIKSLKLSAMVYTGMMFGSTSAHAGQNWGSISSNIITSITTVPGLISALAYMLGVVLGILGVLKIKDHVESPPQTPLKDGLIRLAAGGALFALPAIYEAMFETIGVGQQAPQGQLQGVQFGVIP